MKKKLAQALIGKQNNLPMEDLLKKHSLQIRKSIITMISKAGSGHPAGALGMTDVFTALYFSILKHDPKNPNWKSRDRLILSNGHICPVLYATLAEAGYFPKSELKTLRKIESRLQGHPHYNYPPHNNSLPGVENTSGPLGQGLSQAVGIATSFKMDQKQNRTYCIMSDGELQEGQSWEGLMFAGSTKLNNLTVLIDRNKIQLSGYTKDILALEPLKNKLVAFGWNILEIDGHNTKSITDACQLAKKTSNKPTAIICNTVPGKEVGFMENLPEWHGKVPNKKETEIALKGLERST